MSHLKTLSVASTLFVLLILAFAGYVNAQDPTDTPTATTTITTAEPFAVVGVGTLFVLFGLLVFLLLCLAVIRGSVTLSVLSAVCWFTFAATLFIVSDAESVFVGVFSWISMMLGITMMIFAVWKAANLLQNASEGKKLDQGVM
ncbi:MAG: hypothetical protein LBC12_01820 [Nitrososphaerota archaeon]|jgi:hypothetical protein|nr:hypothetical protein [Nitrososphaerota archaeon]